VTAIYDQGYRRYEARGPLRTLRFWPITREGLRLVLAKRAFLFLVAFAWLPLVVRTVQVWVATQAPQLGQVLQVDGRMFGEFLNQQVFFTLLLSVFGGAGLVASDLRTGAMLVYLSRPLTRRDYVLGKLGVLLALNLSVTLVPGVLLYAIALALSPDVFAKPSLAWIAPAIVLHSCVLSLAVSLLALAVSSLSRSARVAGLGFFALVAGLEMVRGILVHIVGARQAVLLSLQANLRALGNLLFGISPRGAEVDSAWAIVILVGVALACLAILRARVRAVEIVR
jgi:ABC-type transport system involved in multi-copper enzyme maturation permease subunit